MGSALLNTAGDVELAHGGGKSAAAQDAAALRQEHAATVPASVEELRMQVAERLAAHRSKRGMTAAQPKAAEPVRANGARSARIAAAVAERYAQTPSYRAVLAAEAERAIQQARAAAEVAALNAQAIAAAQQRLLEAYDEHAVREAARRRELADGEARLHDFAAPVDERQIDERQAFGAMDAGAVRSPNLWPDLEEPKAGVERAGTARRTGAEDLRALSAAAESSGANADASLGLTVRLYDDAARAERPQRPMVQAARRDESGEAEAMALDEEIAFRQAPVFEEPAGPPLALPANLIEFPRQLVAARKARPRYAEGPLREESQAAPGDGQLRIFEVDPEQISTAPVDVVEQTAQWTSIWLDTPSGTAHREDAAAGWQADETLDETPGLQAPTFDAASFRRRGMAAAINLGIVLTAAAGFAAAFAATADRALVWRTGLPAIAAARQIAGSFLAQTELAPKSLGIAAAASAVFLALLYHGLFFWFNEATPGMRCVRIAFCTFKDGNPTRRAVRRRMLATLVSACPLGMGFAWAALDEDKLTWHDRMSRMYLRRY